MRGTSRLPASRNIAAAAARNLLSAIMDVNVLKLLATWTTKAASLNVSAAVGRQGAELWRVRHGRHLDGAFCLETARRGSRVGPHDVPRSEPNLPFFD